MKDQGVISDHLHVFRDKAMCVVNGEVLRNLAEQGGYETKSFAKELGISRTKIYQRDVPLSAETRKRVVELVRILDNAVQLFDGLEEAVNWLVTPNRSFYNMSPLAMALAGKGESVYQRQEELLDVASPSR